MAAGGYIEFGRVNGEYSDKPFLNGLVHMLKITSFLFQLCTGNLALARALGDFEYKKNYSITPEKQIITADPDVIAHDITDDDEFLVLACDGKSFILLTRN